MKRSDRSWMYEERVDKKKRPITKFLKGVREFIEFARRQDSYDLEERKLRCPCTRCKNLKYLPDIEVEEHLITNGFFPNYYNWSSHGEKYSSVHKDPEVQQNENPYRDMVLDAFEFNAFLNNDRVPEEEQPNPKAKAFFDMLSAAEKPLYEGSKMTLLQVASRIVTLKCEFNMPFKAVDSIATLIEDVIPEFNIMTQNFYNTKKVVKGIQLPHEKIDACPKGCMLFWEDDALLDKCKKCQSDRYETCEGNIVLKGKKGNKRSGKRKKPISLNTLTYFPLAPRLQRMYATKNIANQMTWHKENLRKPGKMCHPSDGEEWKRFDDLGFILI